MKKLLCLALTVALLLCTGVPAQALTNEDVVGTWYLNEITTGGAFLDPSALAMDTTMEIAADGTMTVTNLMNGTLKYNWEIDGETLRTTLTNKPDYALTYDMRERCLLIGADGMGMVFGRERVVMESYQPGAQVDNAQLADFCGEWEAHYMSYQGLVLPFVTTGMTVKLAISEDGATMNDTENGETTTLTYTLSFADGALTLTDANETGHEFSFMRLGLLTDGYLCYESEQGNIYFRPFTKESGDRPDALAEAMAYYDAKEYDKAFPIFATLADTGHGEAIAYLGKCYEKGYGVAIDMARALELYQLAAEQNVPFGVRSLGDMYYYGNAVEQSFERAMALYREAADMGYAPAISAIGFIYETGKGVEVDPAEAAKWYQRAADLGSDQAQYNLGLLYYKGSGVEQNVAKTVELFTTAAEQGNAAAAYNMGYFYSKGIGVTQDAAKSIEWFMRAADLGDATAQYNMGIRYLNGMDVPQDYAKAAELLEASAKEGVVQAINALGYLYENGLGVSQDYIRAAELYGQAADAGNANAQNNLAMFYYNGTGVEKDLQKSKELFELAAAQGHENAIATLAEYFGAAHASE